MRSTLLGGAVTRVVAVSAALVLFAGPQQPRAFSISAWNAEPRLAALRSAANQFVSTGNYAEAARLFEAGSREAAARKNQSLELHFLTGLGAARFALFEYRSAIDTLIRARELARSAGNQRYLSAICANLCNIYMQSGDIVSARSAAENCLHVPSGMSVPYRSQLLATLGLLAGMSGDMNRAEAHLRSAVEAAESGGDDRMRFEAWNHYAQLLFNRGDLAGAEIAALNAFHAGRLERVGEVRPLYLLLSRIYRSEGNTALASALVERGLATPARSRDRQLWKMYFLYERALLGWMRGQSSQASSDLRLALSYARDWREAIAPSDSLRSGAQFWLKGVYDAYIDLAARDGFPAEAFLAVEEERSASLLQVLADRGRNPDPGILARGAYWEDLARLRALEIERIANPSGFKVDRLDQVRWRLSEADALAGTDFISSAGRNTENFLSADTLTILQQRIAPEEALFSFRLASPASYVWALTGDRLEMHRLAGSETLVGLAERFRQAVAEGTSDRDWLGAELYVELFGKISGGILAKPNWIVASDDAIYDIPFSALVISSSSRNNDRSAAANQEPMYLVERHATRRIPSAFLLGGAAGPTPAPAFLGIGDAIYNTADDRWGQLRTTRIAGWPAWFGAQAASLPVQLPRLVSSAPELKSCAAAAGLRHTATFLTGVDLSRERLVAAMRSRPAIVHIAAHVLHPTGEPGQALIHLGLNSTGSAEVLTSRDIVSLPAAGALVVLSACSSAAGNSIRGSGVRGMTRSWLIAGARGVVGSRWPVPDDSGGLFCSFYSHMGRPDARAAELGTALQHAQVEMLTSHTWRSNPRYWAAFYLLSKN